MAALRFTAASFKTRTTVLLKGGRIRKVSSSDTLKMKNYVTLEHNNDPMRTFNSTNEQRGVECPEAICTQETSSQFKGSKTG